MQQSHVSQHMLQNLLQHLQVSVMQCNAEPAGRTPHLIACAAVVEHNIGQRLYAVLVQRRDARAQVRLVAIRRAEALVVARQVALMRKGGSEWRYVCYPQRCRAQGSHTKTCAIVTRLCQHSVCIRVRALPGCPVHASHWQSDHERQCRDGMPKEGRGANCTAFPPYT